ncbi:MAG: hypothetical protein ACR2ML_11070 [Solirubrobacteraceae bacterium]
MTTAQQAPPGALPCPQCGSALDEGQDWCLHCGRGATTRVLAAGNWRIPIVAACLVAAIAGAGVAALFLALSGGDNERIVTSGELTTTLTVTTQGPAPPGQLTPTAPPPPTAPPETTPTSPPSTDPPGG